MSVGAQLDSALQHFEEQTEGIMGSCVIDSTQALMMAEASQNYNRSVIQGMSERFMRLAIETLSALVDSPKLRSVTVEEHSQILYIRPINEKYHVVVLTDKSEIPGLREMNIKELITKLNNIL